MKKNKIAVIITVALLTLTMMTSWTPNVSATSQKRIILPFHTSWEDSPYQAIGRTNSVDLSLKKDFYGYPRKILASEDSTVYSGQPSKNYGDLGIITAALGPITEDRAWLKFPLSSLPAGEVPISVKLYLHAVLCNINAYVDVHFSSTDTWTEMEITWSNQPTYGSAISSVYVTDTYVWYSWDVTDVVKNELSGDKVISLVMTNKGPNSAISFNSIEDDDGNLPFLAVAYSPSPELGWRYNEVSPPSDVFGYEFGSRQLMAAGWFGASNSYCYFNLFDMGSDYAPPFKIKPHTFINIWYYHMNLGDCMIDAELYNKNTHQYSALRDFSYNGKFIVDQNGVRIHPAYRCNDPINSGSWQFASFDLSIVYESDPENWYVTKIWIGFDNGNDHATGQARTYFDMLYISYGIGGVQTKTDGHDNAWTSGSVVVWDWYGPDSYGYYKLWLKLTISGFNDGYIATWDGARFYLYPYVLRVTTSYGVAQAQVWPDPTGANLTQPLTTPPVWSFILDSIMAISGKLTGGFTTAYSLALKFFALQKTPAAQPTYEWPWVEQPDWYNEFGPTKKSRALGEVYIEISELSAGIHTIPITFDVDYYMELTPDPWDHYETVSCPLYFSWSTIPDSLGGLGGVETVPIDRLSLMAPQIAVTLMVCVGFIGIRRKFRK